MSYFAPTTLDDALTVLSGGATTVLAGGTDVFPALQDRPAPSRILDITRIEGLRGITETPHGWRIGAATRWSDLFGAGLPAQFDGLVSAAREVGSIQIQNAGTIAGNLCNASPAADGVPPLLTLEARVELAGPAGTRTLPLDEFLQGPRRTAIGRGELVTAIDIPRLAGRSAFAKLGSRTYLVISITMVAVLLDLDGHRIRTVRLAVGSCAETAKRLNGLEGALAGLTLAEADQRVATSDLAPLTPMDDVRGTRAFRMAATRSLVTRTLRMAAGG